MPHLRRRHITSAISKTLGASPLVGILGHRQVGKTTLLELLAPSYYSLDNPDIEPFVRRDVNRFLRELPMSGTKGLDECQTAESLFPALKEWIRKHPRPGQFLLSGSVRFTSKKSIRESLTGRIMYHELYPLLISELLEEPIPTTLMQLIRADGFRQCTMLLQSIKLSRAKKSAFQKYFEQGGLPGICFLRNTQLRANKIEDQLATVLDRDLRSLVQTTLTYRELRFILGELAVLQGAPVDWSHLARETGISRPTVKKIVQTFENLFLIRGIPIEGGRKGIAYYFEDMAEQRQLAPNPSQNQMSHFIFTHARGQFAYALAGRFEYFQYLTRSGAIVPIALRTEEGCLGFLPLEGPTPTLSERRAAESFLKTYAKSKVLLLYHGAMEVLTDRLIIVDPLRLV